jgi:hypothetical protein
MFNSQIRDFERLQDEKDATKLIFNEDYFERLQANPSFNEYLECIKKHDYSYMMSDDDRVWQNGAKAEKYIQSLIEKMIENGANVFSLKLRTLTEVPQQFTDADSNGNDLTHRVIRGWFIKFENQ